jgi:putative selenate reductase FAD-binding subunit
MILEYHRPETLEDALLLLQREVPTTLPLGGGTMISNMRQSDFAVVDLQKLNLDYFRQEDRQFTIGATLSMQSLADKPTVNPQLSHIIHNQFSANLRQMVTVGGEVVACDGRSDLVTALLAIDARLVWMPGNQEVALGDYLPLRSGFKKGKLLIEVQIPAQGTLLIEKVARSPQDLSILSVAIYRWPSGRTRVALGGFGVSPILAFDGADALGAEQAVKSAYLQANDEWASGEYRSRVAGQLTEQMLRSYTIH